MVIGLQNIIVLCDWGVFIGPNYNIKWPGQKREISNNMNKCIIIGMVGELVRTEAEIAIAPLTINSQREQVSII